ncbi:Alkyl/aryl-sulfatase BDS1 [uncultured delta proteobacterium]|uniref:Linear primary-alkylsulfatase n=1 Tax=uncultured delta proteobacterium TaxID=34034 RepID=A0A212K465_9DELT|nr:Alkyl/aryl-sulfatase BDS1 [uncultured delta proteobacterium]
MRKKLLVLLCLAFMLACVTAAAAAEKAPVLGKSATDKTKAANAAILKKLPFSNTQDFDDANRGFIATIPDLVINDAHGHPVWNLKDYAFLKQETAPDTVNPSLWRQSRLNMTNGLFKVVDRVYQIRGFDLSNMTIIEGDTGLILIDPLVSPETSKAGLDLYRAHGTDKPVVAVIYTHSHIDHYGGVKGVTTEDDVKAGKVKIIAPDKFLEEAVSENVYAGTAMGRRALYHTGALLPKSPTGQVDDGLGKTASLGASTLIAPTDTVTATGQKMTVDGVDMEFILAPGTEAPAEMLIYFPQFKLLDAAEDCTHTVHNLYTLRGAQVRDAKNWWKSLNTALVLYGTDVQAIIAQHHWPMWGNDRVNAILVSQRDMYKFIHDQTLNLANKGFTSVEIAERLTLPASLAGQWWNRDYYGSVNHDAKAVYQRYLGWYDGNPSNLYVLPPVDSAKKYVEYMGGAAAITEKAKKDFAAGNYRWVAEVMNKVVFADPNNAAAKGLLADTLEQLGYQTENGTWRNNFLQGAFELRNGTPKIKIPGVATPDVVKAMSPDMLLDYMGIRLNAAKAEGKVLTIAWMQPGQDAPYAIELQNSALIYTQGKKLASPGATITAASGDLAEVLMGQASLSDKIKDGSLAISGNGNAVQELFSLLDEFELMFNIVTP